MGVLIFNQNGSVTKQTLTVFASAQRTVTTNSSDQITLYTKGIRLFLNISAYVGGTLDVKIQSKDTLTGNYEDIPGAAFAQKSATGQDDLIIYPGIAETANEAVSDAVPAVWRAVATMATTPDMTFSLVAVTLP